MEKRSILQKAGKGAERFMLACSILCILWLWWCCISTWIPADRHPYIAVTNITFPIALLFNLIAILAWAVIKVKRAWIPLVGILPCWSYIMDYSPVSFNGEVPKDCLKILSWNTESMGGADGMEEAMDYIKNSDADIICLQEANTNYNPDFNQEMAERGYERHQNRSFTLYTRLHILESDTVPCTSLTTNGSQWYRLSDGKKEYLLINNHLESNHLSPELKRKYTDALKNPEYRKAKESGRSIVSHMVEAQRYRGKQARTLRGITEKHKGENIILCGDFNDTPISYTCQHLARGGMKNAFRESGNGISVSYNKKGFWVRIDHIFLSENGESYKTYIDQSIAVSDHYPIISWVNFQ